MLSTMTRANQKTLTGFLVLDDLELNIPLEAEFSGVFDRAMVDIDPVYESRVHRVLYEEDLGTVEGRQSDLPVVSQRTHKVSRYGYDVLRLIADIISGRGDARSVVRLPRSRRVGGGGDPDRFLDFDLGFLDWGRRLAFGFCDNIYFSVVGVIMEPHNMVNSI